MMEGVVALVLISLIATSNAGVVSKSSKEECILEGDVKTHGNRTCSTKLVVSVTVTANEGKSQVITAKVSRIIDATEKKLKNYELKTPLRIRIIKSPIIINFPLYQVGYVSNWPREEVVRFHHNREFRCKDTWYASDSDVNCGFARDNEGRRIFGSQGFCCQCSYMHRGWGALCSGFTNKANRTLLQKRLDDKNKLHVGHCLRHDGFKYFVMGFQPPALQFTITVTLEKRSYVTENGSMWETVSELEIGPQKRIALSDTHTVKAEYVADFHPSTFIRSQKLVHRFLLVPDLSTLPRVRPYNDLPHATWRQFKASVHNMSEWLAIDKKYFDMSGTGCNKIGVSYTAFKYQPNRCENPYKSCLYDQPYLLWNKEKIRQKEGREGNFMLHNFGKLHSLPHTKGRTDFQVNFIADRPTTSVMVLTMAADDLKVITKVSPGRIVSAFIDPFEALSTTGTLLVILQNTGSYTATYNVFVQHCSAGIDLIPSRTITVDPNESVNLTFVIHSFHSVGKINRCDLNLYDANSRLLDNLTVTIETYDTCFCYGFCGCACGNNKTVCPDAPERPDSKLEAYQVPWYQKVADAFKKFGELFKLHAGKFLITFWVVMILVFLGVLKVVHIIITGEVKYKAVADPIIIVVEKVKEIAEYILKQWCPAFCDNLWTSCGRCCRFCSRRCCWMMTCGTAVEKDEPMLYKERIERGWRPPPYCNGMCKGAKYRRRLHRRLMRVMKRTGQRKDTPWFSRPYNCSCRVKDATPCIDICKGLFFFFYCPLLPLYWILEFCFLYLRRKWRRRKRIAAYRAEKAAREADKERQYFQMDKYSRGKLEKEIVDLDKELKEITRLEKEYEADMKAKEQEEMQLDATSDREDRNMSSEAGLSDTSDPDHANDIEELIAQGFPVYFNFAIPKSSHSLKNPGHNYSIKGRITRRKKREEVRYCFDLAKCTTQLQQVVDKKVKPLTPPFKLNPHEFFQSFKNPDRTLRLVTMVPLFPCLNEVQKKSNKSDTKKEKFD